MARKTKKIKVKTHRGAAKRFQVTASGKILRRRSHKRHLLASKHARRIRRLRKVAEVHPADVRNVREMLPYA